MGGGGGGGGGGRFGSLYGFLCTYRAKNPCKRVSLIKDRNVSYMSNLSLQELTAFEKEGRSEIRRVASLKSIHSP